MKTAKLILLTFLIFIVQIAIAPNISIGSSFPSFLSIFIMIYLLNFKFDEALIVSGVAGLMMDLYSPLHFGIYTVGFLLLYFITYIVFKKFISDQSIFVVTPAFFIGYLIANFIVFIVTKGSYGTYFGSALYTTILGTMLYYLVTGRFEKRSSTYELSNKL